MMFPSVNAVCTSSWTYNSTTNISRLTGGPTSFTPSLSCNSLPASTFGNVYLYTYSSGTIADSLKLRTLNGYNLSIGGNFSIGYSATLCNLLTGCTADALINISASQKITVNGCINIASNSRLEIYRDCANVAATNCSGPFQVLYSTSNCYTGSWGSVSVTYESGCACTSQCQIVPSPGPPPGSKKRDSQETALTPASGCSPNICWNGMMTYDTCPPMPSPSPTSKPPPVPSPAVPTPLPTSIPTAVPTPKPTSTSVPTPVSTPIPTPTPTPTPAPIPTPTPTPTSTPTPVRTPTPIPTPTPLPTPTPIPTPSPQPIPTPTPEAIPTPDSTPIPDSNPPVVPPSRPRPTSTAVPASTLAPLDSSSPLTPSTVVLQPDAAPISSLTPDIVVTVPSSGSNPTVPSAVVASGLVPTTADSSSQSPAIVGSSMSPNTMNPLSGIVPEAAVPSALATSSQSPPVSTATSQQSPFVKVSPGTAPSVLSPAKGPASSPTKASITPQPINSRSPSFPTSIDQAESVGVSILLLIAVSLLAL